MMADMMSMMTPAAPSAAPKKKAAKRKPAKKKAAPKKKAAKKTTKKKAAPKKKAAKKTTKKKAQEEGRQEDDEEEGRQEEGRQEDDEEEGRPEEEGGEEATKKKAPKKKAAKKTTKKKSPPRSCKPAATRPSHYCFGPKRAAPQGSPVLHYGVPQIAASQSLRVGDRRCERTVAACRAASSLPRCVAAYAAGLTVDSGRRIRLGTVGGRFRGRGFASTPPAYPAPLVATARLDRPPAFATGTTSLVTRSFCPAASVSWPSPFHA